MQQVSPIKNKDDIRAMYEVLKSHSERDYLLFSLAISSGKYFITLSCNEYL